MYKNNMFAKFKILLATLILLILFSATVYSHPGRTDANGGHYVRTAGYGYPVGSYHYHNNPSTTKPVTYPKTTQSTNQLINTTNSQNAGDFFVHLFIAIVAAIYAYIFFQILIVHPVDEHMSDNQKLPKIFKEIVLIALKIMAVLTSLYVARFFLS